MKSIFFLLAILSLSLTLAAPVGATHYGGMLSPGLMNLSEDVCMIRSGLLSGEITFTSEDFRSAVGATVDSVTVTALPPASAGTLLCGDVPVTANQTLSGESLNSLRFVPSNTCTEASFRFKSGGEYSIDCILRYTDSVNRAPTVDAKTSSAVRKSAGSMETSAGSLLWTQKDITVYDTLSATDPDGDALTFEITRYPENGLLELTNPSTGDYRYTPCDGVTGEDSFSYTVRDEWGNYAAEASVTVEIDRAAADLVFADMDGHWAHNAALVMAAENAMDVETSGGEIYFRPDEPISREDFLVTVMKTLGAGEIEPSATVFADEGEMDAASTGYVARAYNLGIVKGSEEGGVRYFRPSETVTRAEAAVMLNAILGLEEPDTVAVFADDHAVPAWARGALYALSEAGIFSGTGAGNLSPNAELSRGAAAQVLLTVKRYVE